MTRAESLEPAEVDETQRNTQSQDSQAILEALRVEFAIVSSRSAQSPPIRQSNGSPEPNENVIQGTVDYESDQDEGVRLVQDQDGNISDGTTDANVHVQEQNPSPKAAIDETTGPFAGIRQPTLPPSDNTFRTHPAHIRDTSAAVETPLSNGATRDDASQVVKESQNRDTAPLAAPVPPLKMDVSQHTPTQVNDERDYSDLPDTLPASHGDPNPPYEDQTLHTNDTGAVNLGDFTQVPHPSSQVSEDAGFENKRGEWRLPEETPRPAPGNGHNQPSFTAPPETPAMPKNPFGARPNIAAPLAGSQLFGQTQMSSAIKRISPTSSRPSPHIYHDTVSPNIMESSPLKDRAGVSSPTDIRTSSPSRLHELPSTVRPKRRMDAIQEESPSMEGLKEDNLIQETPSHRPPRSSGVYNPRADYESIKKSQERQSMMDAQSSNLEPDSDSDDAVKRMERRKRIEEKKSRAEKEMEQVRLPRSRRAVPDQEPGLKRRRVIKDTSELSEAPESFPVDKARLLATPSLNSVIVDLVTPAVGKETPRIKATPAQDDVETEGGEEPEDKPPQPFRPSAGDVDVIPATSPVQSSSVDRNDAPTASESELPRLVPENAITTPNLTPASDVLSSSNPPTRRRGLRTYNRKARVRDPFVGSSTSATDSTPVPLGQKASHPLTVESSPVKKDPVAEEPAQQSKTVRTRNEKRRRATTGSQIDEPEVHGKRLQTAANGPRESSSELSILSSAHPSGITTPGTFGSPASERTEVTAGPSPSGGPTLRKRATRSAAESPQPATRATRLSRRSIRLESESTDELQGSPGAVGEKSTIQLSAGRSLKMSLGHRGGGIFEGMMFAVSVQSDQQKQRASLEAKISQAGGVILRDGFRELFERSAIMKATSPVEEVGDSLRLIGSKTHTGFTALIADTHSRKPKYMQALALGLPCLAQQWIVTCLNKGEVVDWQPYLLCAGSSAVLGNAIRSRNLLPYPAEDAMLAETIGRRARLLEDQRVLVVIDSRKGRSETKEPYIFLFQALGPSMSRVFSTVQAREALREAEAAGQPFDWLYVDTAGGSSAVLSSPAVKTKKRRRVSEPKLQQPRELTDELVIQSLILGKMIEEDEMVF
ncbi:hypothetical protein B0I35DRAFT_478828 [Stachybotrys elegans]|uniref:BRCT domain-containing protein n=1 Tax=Stachybotrys elegans TaxID=80388 RepID=A0A8K0WRR2_9HYPO|nr:hypothetical protein B0I35DRAFT_478828 [Stachybotrys elegans]